MRASAPVDRHRGSSRRTEKAETVEESGPLGRGEYERNQTQIVADEKRMQKNIASVTFSQNRP